MKHAVIGLLGLTGLALSASDAAAADAAPCKLKVYSTLAITTDQNGMVQVPVTVAGQTVNFIVDTGSGFTAIREALAHKLGLQFIGLEAQRLRMFDGTDIAYGAEAPGTMLGKLPLGDKYSFMVMPDGEQFPAEGLLGEDLLSIFDVDFDFAGGKMHLIAPSDCGDAVVYWTGNYAKVPISMGDASGINDYNKGLVRVGSSIDTKPIYAHANLDGKDVRVQFDTGAFATVIRYSQAKFLLGLREDDPNLKPVKTPRKDGLPMYTYTFKTMAIGGITVNNPVLYVIGSPANEHVDVTAPMLLGMDVLRKLHIYLSYQNRMMYVSAATAGTAPATKTN
jgi:predicted aspartyl protease